MKVFFKLRFAIIRTNNFFSFLRRDFSDDHRRSGLRKMLHIMGCVTKFNELATTAENMIVLKKACDLNTRFIRSPNKQPDYLHSASRPLQVQNSQL